MPYIPEEDRPRFDRHINELAVNIKTVGELNYVIFRLACKVVDIIGQRYANISWVKAAMTDARDEFHHRVMRPYEDRMEDANGDVIVKNNETVRTTFGNHG